MTYVSISRLTKTFEGKPPVTVINGLDLDIQEGEFFVLLGPSGCGKTTTLRCLAGLETPTSGEMSLGNSTVFDSGRRLDVPTHKRNIGVVFQSYALWPHMSVGKNVAYPLKARGLKSKLAEGWVEEALRLVECEHLIDRLPGQLSGGQQQRVAMARGLVARPDLILFDEPMSNLDARLRDVVRSQLHELHSKLGFTAVFVTHDQSEALALGDRLAIMRNGAIEQLGTPQDLYERPATDYVAGFIGMTNAIVLQRAEAGWVCEDRAIHGATPRLDTDASSLTARLRPDDIRVLPKGSPINSSSMGLNGMVIDQSYGGRHIDVTVQVGPQRVYSRELSSSSTDWIRGKLTGEDVVVSFEQRDARFFDGDGGHALVVASDKVQA